MQTVTAKDIAARIQRKGESLQAAADRLKNWTSEGLIKPRGEKNPGRGRSRQYPQRAVFEAVFLQLLVDLGMSAVTAAALLKMTMGGISPGEFTEKCKGLFFLTARSLDWSDNYAKVGKKWDIEAVIEVHGSRAVQTIIDLELVYQSAFPEEN